VIDGQPARSPSAPAALAWRRGAAAFQLSSPDTRAPVFMRRILDLCGDAQGAPAAPPFAACLAGSSVVIAFDDRGHAHRVAAAARDFARVMPLDDVALLSAVGESLAAEPQVAAGVLEALHDVTIHASVHHPSGRSLTMLVDDADAGEAMRRVYERFFGAGSAESGRLARGCAS
jgi:aspartokinase